MRNFTSKIKNRKLIVALLLIGLSAVSRILSIYFHSSGLVIGLLGNLPLYLCGFLCGLPLGLLATLVCWLIGTILPFLRYSSYISHLNILFVLLYLAPKGLVPGLLSKPLETQLSSDRHKRISFPRALIAGAACALIHLFCTAINAAINGWSFATSAYGVVSSGMILNQRVSPVINSLQFAAIEGGVIAILLTALCGPNRAEFEVSSGESKALVSGPSDGSD